MIRLLLVFLGSMLLVAGCDSSGPAGQPLVSEQRFGTEHYDAGLDLLQTPDGGLVVGGIGHGVVAPTDGTIPTPNLTRLGADGQVQWSRLYGDLRGGDLLAVRENDQGGYAVLISTGGWTSDEYTLRLVAVGPNGRRGRTLYERAGVTARSNQTLRRTRDGGFILAGAPPNAGAVRRAFLVRLGTDGQVRWEQSFDGILDVWAVTQTTDGGFVVIGEKGTEAASYEDVLLVKVSPEGSVQWMRAYGAEERQERGLAMVPAASGGVVVVGQSDYYGEDTGEEWAYALHVASDGTERWSATYGGEAEYVAQAVTALQGGGFMLAGHRRAPGGETEALLIRIDEQGEQQWRRAFGDEGRIDAAHALIELRDGRLAVTGATGPDEPGFGGADFDVFVRFVSPDAYLSAP